MFSPMAQQPVMGQGLLIREAFTIILRHMTVGRTPLDEWSAWRKHLSLPVNTQHSQQADLHAAGGIQTHSLCRRAAAPRGHWDRPENAPWIKVYKLKSYFDCSVTILMLVLGDDAVLSELRKNLLPPSSGKLRNLWKSNPLGCVVH